MAQCTFKKSRHTIELLKRKEKKHILSLTQPPVSLMEHYSPQIAQIVRIRVRILGHYISTFFSV